MAVAPLPPLGRAPLVSPAMLLTGLFVASAGAMVYLRVYAGVTAPEIPADELRRVAAVFRRLADDIDGGADPQAGVEAMADRAAGSVRDNNGGEGIEAFLTLYTTSVGRFPELFARDCRVLAAACDGYAQLVEDTRKTLAELDNMIMQVVFLVAFQPMTTALYGVAQAWATARIAQLAKLAQIVKALLSARAASILGTTGKYLLTTSAYALIDGLAYATGSIAVDKLTKLSHGQPLGTPGETLEEYKKIMASNTAYILGYDATKAGMFRGTGPDTRTGELFARLMGSGFGYTPTYSALSDDDNKIFTTREEWLSKIEGHGLRAVIFPPGWKFGRPPVR